MKTVKHTDLINAYEEVGLIITKCEKIQLKFKDRSSQHTLLRNRIKAMTLSKLLLENEFVKLNINNPSHMHDFVLKNVKDQYTEKELEDALKPIKSILSKSENAQKKYDTNTRNFNRYINLIQSMRICESLLEDELKHKSLISKTSG